MDSNLRVDGEEKEFSTKEQIDTISWNGEKGMVRGNKCNYRYRQVSDISNSTSTPWGTIL